MWHDIIPSSWTVLHVFHEPRWARFIGIWFCSNMFVCSGVQWMQISLYGWQRPSSSWKHPGRYALKKRTSHFWDARLFLPILTWFSTLGIAVGHSPLVFIAEFRIALTYVLSIPYFDYHYFLKNFFALYNRRKSKKFFKKQWYSKSLTLCNYALIQMRDNLPQERR